MTPFSHQSTTNRRKKKKKKKKASQPHPFNQTKNKGSKKKKKKKKILEAFVEGGGRGVLGVVVGDEGIEAVDGHLPIRRHHLRWKATTVTKSRIRSRIRGQSVCPPENRGTPCNQRRRQCVLSVLEKPTRKVKTEGWKRKKVWDPISTRH